MDPKHGHVSITEGRVPQYVRAPSPRLCEFVGSKVHAFSVGLCTPPHQCAASTTTAVHYVRFNAPIPV